MIADQTSPAPPGVRTPQSKLQPCISRLSTSCRTHRHQTARAIGALHVHCFAPPASTPAARSAVGLLAHHSHSRSPAHTRDCSPPAPSPPPANLARSRRSNSDAHRASVFVQPATAAGVNLPLPGTAEACYVPPRVSVYVPGNGADARRANGANVYVDTERGTACRAVSRRTRGNPWEPAGGGLRRTSHCTVRNMAPDGFVSCYVLTRLPPSYVSLSAAYVPCT